MVGGGSPPPPLRVFDGGLLRGLLLRPGAAEDGSTLVSFSWRVTAQHGTLRPGELGFHFVELAGVIDVLRLRREQRRNFVLHPADTFLGFWIAGKKFCQQLMHGQLIHDPVARQLGHSAMHEGFSFLQFFKSCYVSLWVVASSVLILNSQQVRLVLGVATELFER